MGEELSEEFCRSAERGARAVADGEDAGPDIGSAGVDECLQLLVEGCLAADDGGLGSARKTPTSRMRV